MDTSSFCTSIASFMSFPSFDQLPLPNCPLTALPLPNVLPPTVCVSSPA
jgi:hypothetical protein